MTKFWTKCLYGSILILSIMFQRKSGGGGGGTVASAFATTSSSSSQGIQHRISTTNLSATKKPTLVVGATGKVGQKVVKQLLSKNIPVRALVRNKEKANEIFGNDNNNNNNNNNNKLLELIVADLTKYDTDDSIIYENAVNGCDNIISVSGTMRFSKLNDFFPPWKLLKEDKSTYIDDDRSHPYYTNYKAQCNLINLAEKYSIINFIRLTGLSTGFSPFAIFSIIFSTLLSMSSRYHFLCEQYLLKSNIPNVIILRPGGLAEEDRDPSTTFLQIDSSGLLPPPSRVPRTDVAALAVAACDSTLLDTSKKDKIRLTLAIRAVGDIKPKPQGEKDDGYETAEECIKNLNTATTTTTSLILSESDISSKSTKYAIAVGGFVYLFSFGIISFVVWLLRMIF